MNPTAPIDDLLSAFTVTTAWEDLPTVVQERTLDLLVDAIANALVGRQAQSTPSIERLMFELCGDGASTIVGGGTASPTAASFVNGHQITAFTMCDVYRPALCHITPEVVPPLLEAALERRSSGEQLLTAFAIGLEVTARLGLAVDYDRFRARGWHSPGVIGPFGAAAAVARLLELDLERTQRALGLAGSQAAGTFAALGTPAVKFHQARGATAGLWAARFAADGLGGTDRPLTHPDGGLLATYADGGRPGFAVAELGERWELMEISMRRWPAASSLQALVECALELATERGVQPDDVEELVVSLPPTPYEMCARMGWEDELTAMQSARYVAAAVLHDRGCWVGQFSEARRSDEQINEFALERVVVVADAELPPTGTRVTVWTASQSRVEAVRDEPLGAPARPLSSEDVRDKLNRAAHDVPTRLGRARLTDVLATLPAVGDAADLITGLGQPEPGDDTEAAGSRSRNREGRAWPGN